MRTLVLDTDTASDDAVALMMALRHPDVRVEAITVVAGNVGLDQAVQNALYVADLCGRGEVPVHAGATRPLLADLVTARGVHGRDGMGDVGLPVSGRHPAEGHAVDVLIDTFLARPSEIDLVTLGPLTNVALAIERDPEWVKRIAGIALMGGSTDVGNVTRVAEFNVYADPEAAERVFRSGADITMCGLNLTHQVMTTDAVAERLRGAGTPVAGFAAQVFDDLHGRIAALTGFREAALHDPCAVLAVTHPELIESAPRAVSVELDGTLTRGMTVVDQRRGLRGDPANAHVGYRIDAERALQVVLESLGVESQPG